METKLTLKLDAAAIARAKQYAEKHKGESLSKLVENYFRSLTKDAAASRATGHPIVSSLAGVAAKTKGKNAKVEYTKYLEEKYR